MTYGLSEQQLQQIIDLLAKFPQIEKAVLFGSRALGTYKKGSDVDIALMGSDVDFTLAAHIKYELEETYLPYFLILLPITVSIMML